MSSVICFSINFAATKINPLFFPFILSSTFLNDFFEFWSYKFLNTIYIQPPSDAKRRLFERIDVDALTVLNELHKKYEEIFSFSYNLSCINYYVHLSSTHKYTILIVTEYLFVKYLYLNEVTQEMFDYWLTKYSRLFLDYPRSYIVIVIDNNTQTIKWTNINSSLPQNISDWHDHLYSKEVNEKIENLISSSFQDARKFPNISSSTFADYT